MVYRIAIFAVFAALPVLAQTASQEAALQQPAWIGVPGSNTVTVHITSPAGQTGPVQQKPFSATEVRHTQQTLEDGTHIDHTDSSHFYRDTEGRMRDESTTGVLLFDPVAGHTYEIDPKSKTYKLWPVASKGSTTIAAFTHNSHSFSNGKQGPPQPVETAQKDHVPYHAEPVEKFDTEDLGTRMVDGVLCHGSRTTMIIPVATLGNDRDIKLVDERWFSDDLQSLVKSINSDPRFGVTTYELTNIVQSDPDQSLFDIPSNYTLVEQSH
jgi:hypothetical protein